jgi:hypothetical protein
LVWCYSVLFIWSGWSLISHGRGSGEPMLTVTLCSHLGLLMTHNNVLVWFRQHPSINDFRLQSSWVHLANINKPKLFLPSCRATVQYLTAWPLAAIGHPFRARGQEEAVMVGVAPQFPQRSPLFWIVQRSVMRDTRILSVGIPHLRPFDRGIKSIFSLYLTF